jgi:hypothetical protein
VGECESSGSGSPLQSSKPRSVRRSTSPWTPLLSWGSDTSRSLETRRYPAHWLRVPSPVSIRPRTPDRPLRSSHRVPPRRSDIGSATSHRFSVPFRVSPSVLARPHCPGLTALVGFAPLRRLPDIRSPLNPGLPHPVRCAFRLSQPPGALLLRTPPGLVSCR